MSTTNSSTKINLAHGYLLTNHFEKAKAIYLENKTAFIIPHLGSLADYWRAQLGLIDHLACAALIYWDRLSSVRRRIRFCSAPMVLGCIPVWRCKIRALRLRPDAEQRVLGGNLFRLIARVNRQVPRRPAVVSPMVRLARSKNETLAAELRDPWVSEHALCG